MSFQFPTAGRDPGLEVQVALHFFSSGTPNTRVQLALLRNVTLTTDRRHVEAMSACLSVCLSVWCHLSKSYQKVDSVKLFSSVDFRTRENVILGDVNHTVRILDND